MRYSLYTMYKLYLELLISYPKDELHEWYVVYTWYILGITLTYL